MYKLMGCILAIASAICSANEAISPTFHDVPALTGSAQGAVVANNDGVRFVFKAGAAIRSTPALRDNTLYFGSNDANVYAIDAKTGAERWRFKTRGAVTSSPAADGGDLFVSSRDGNLYALGLVNGVEHWHFGFGRDVGANDYWDYFAASPVLADRRIYVGSGDGHVYCIDADSGKVIWKFDAGSRVRSTTAVSGNSVVFGTMSGYVVAVDRTNGKQRWRFATAGATHTFADKQNDTTAVPGSPSISEGIVTIGGRDGFVYGLDLSTGKQKWRQTHDGSSWILATATDSSTVYVASGSASILQAADLTTGKERWRFKTHGAVFASPVLADNLIYFADFSGLVYAVDRGTGAQRWRFPTGDRVFATPVLGDGILYVASDNGTLFALEGNAQLQSRPLARKIVIREGRKSADAFSWFAGGLDEVITNYFIAQGYELLEAEKLAPFLREQIEAHTPSVVVFSDNQFPSSIVAEESPRALIRQYLDAGGKVAMLGPNPLAYHRDATGDVDKVDYDPARRVFGIDYFKPERMGGWYPTTITAEGHRFGLRDSGIDTAPVDPRQVTTVLAVDEYGNAGSWVKSYGGPKGSGLLQLNVPRTAPTDLAPYQAAIEYGLN
jgi:eukaryotic-like serine/threonine-protein kinase